jgi:crotonobetainyl-CoA:carnitine CoA-transferase CaiB-like acyl-CoA transferase
VLSREEIMDHEQIRINELIEEHDFPAAGRVRQPRPAARFGVTPARIQRPAPALGEHSGEVLAAAGFSAAEIAALADIAPR